MRTLLTRRAGEPGTKRPREEWGEDLVCVRYRYDEARMERLKTVEIVIERVEWRHREKRRDDGAAVRVKIEEREDLLRRAVLFAGGRWDEATDTWLIAPAAATALGLQNRIMRLPRRVLHIDRETPHHR